MSQDHQPASGARHSRIADSRPAAEAPQIRTGPLDDTPTAKLRAFLKSGRYRPAENLDVYSGNFNFAPLGAIETADMRHQRERRHEPPPAEPKRTRLPARGPDAPAGPAPLRTPAAHGRSVQTTPFVMLSEELCLHRHGRHEGCRCCIENCSGAAIQAGPVTPLIDAAACLGCGVCTSSCPSGAMEWRPLARSALLQQLRAAIAPQVDRGISPLVVFHDRPFERLPVDPTLRSGTIPVEVATVGILGIDVLLTALALGAAGVVVLTDDQQSERLRGCVGRDIAWSLAVLRAADLDGLNIGMAGSQAPTVLPEVSNSVRRPAARYALDHSKRTLIGLAAAHLIRQSRTPGRTAFIGGAPFGAVELDGAKCTLCLACAGACKLKALRPLKGDAPGLLFEEKDCVQCGLCARVCPEQALTLLPRLNPQAFYSSARVLHRVQMAHCTVCGTAFASQQMISAIQDKLKGHWMYAGAEAQKRLAMCDRCRVQDLFFNPPATRE